MRTKLEKFDHILEKDLEQKLDEIIANGTINPTEVKTVTDAVCLMLKSKEYEEWLRDGEDRGSSFRRGRSPVTGRYVSRRMDMRYPDRAYTMDMYDQDYSGHSIKDRMVSKLEGMVDMAKSDYERQEVLEAIRKIEGMM